jgi:hypothetical protein
MFDLVAGRLACGDPTTFTNARWRTPYHPTPAKPDPCSIPSGFAGGNHRQGVHAATLRPGGAGGCWKHSAAGFAASGWLDRLVHIILIIVHERTKVLEEVVTRV